MGQHSTIGTPFVRMDSGPKSASRPSIRRPLRINPKLATTYLNWGTLLQDQKKYNEAENTGRHLSTLALRATQQMAALVLEDQNKISEAIEVYEETVELPPVGYTYVNLAQLLMVRSL